MKEHKIIIYSTTVCPYCIYTKNFFKEKGVSYEEKNVGLDRAAAKEMIEKSGQMGVPVIDFDGEIIVGYQPVLFEKLLKS